jgi:hypothetical protein
LPIFLRGGPSPFLVQLLSVLVVTPKIFAASIAVSSSSCRLIRAVGMVAYSPELATFTDFGGL